MTKDIFTLLPPTETLETTRLHLKLVDPATWSLMFETLNDEQLKTCLALYNDERLEVERDKWKQGMTTYNISFRNFLLIKKDSREVIGKAGFHTWQVHHHRAEIGYGIDKTEELSKGYMSEALSAIIPYGFEQMNLNRVEAFLSPHNTPSVKLIQRFGFVKEGTLREHYYKNDVHESSDCYAMLRSEFCANRQLFETIR